MASNVMKMDAITYREGLDGKEKRPKVWVLEDFSSRDLGGIEGQVSPCQQQAEWEPREPDPLLRPLCIVKELRLCVLYLESICPLHEYRGRVAAK